MTDYTKSVNFTAKDALSTGDPNKLVKGSDMDTEFDAIETASALKANKISGGTANYVVEQSASGDLVDTGLATPTGTFVGTTDTQTLTNKTLTAPVITQGKLAKGVDVASANALTLGTDGNYFDITGTTAITSITTIAVGTVIKLHFDDALTLTHHSTDLILPTAASITTAAGDEAELVEYAAGDWRCTNYSSAAGTLSGSLLIDDSIGKAKLKSTGGTTSLAGLVAGDGEVDISLTAYSFFPMIHAESGSEDISGGNFMIVSGHTTDGASADSPRFRLINTAPGGVNYDVDYRFIPA